MEILLRPRERDSVPRRRRSPLERGVPGGPLGVYASGREGASGGLPIDQDASICGARMTKGETRHHDLDDGRRAYIVSAHAAITVNGRRAQPQERVLVHGGGPLHIKAEDETELVLLDLP